MTRLTAEDQQVWQGYTSRPSLRFRLRNALAAPPDRLDLHGLSAAQAHRRVLALIDAGVGVHRSLIVITGCGGILQRECPLWLAGCPAVRQVETVEGGGALRVRLVRLKR